MKYYAVKTGRAPGIYTTWDDCRAQVHGYPGAVYKSFTARAAAEAFLAPEAAPAPKSACAAYVDGSYNIRTGEYGFGVVLLIAGEEQTFSGRGNDPDLAAMRNVAGELMAAEFILRRAASEGLPSIDIYYDYEGIAAWAEGRWKTNRAGTRAYKALYDALSPALSVRFVKVKGHSGDKYNDLADALAKAACGNA